MSTLSDAPVRTVADQVCDRLRSDLLAGVYEPGLPLREEELAARFKVSRHPIRKALQKLSLEGLLVARPNCGVIVAHSQLEHVDGLLTPMRVQLELYALNRAFPGLTSARRKDWREILRQMERAGEDGDVQALLDQDAAFHQRLLLVAGLEEMMPVWQAIFGRMRDAHRQGNEALEDLGSVAFGHNRLIESLFGGDLTKALADWRSHLENGEFNKRNVLDYHRLKSRAK